MSCAKERSGRGCVRSSVSKQRSMLEPGACLQKLPNVIYLGRDKRKSNMAPRSRYQDCSFSLSNSLGYETTLQTHADDALNLSLNAGATSEFYQPEDSPPYPSRSTRTPLYRYSLLP